MATHGELTTGKLIDFLKAFPSDTKVVLGQKDTDEVGLECWANTYYPPTKECTQWVVIDHGQHW